LAVTRPVHIRWNAQAVPWIEAETDADAAYALGLVHAHLRLAQLHMLKRIAQGRVAEMLGPLAVGLDHALRLLDLSGAATRCETRLPDDTRDWLDAFVRGLNEYQSRQQQWPPEFRWLALKPEPWTRGDILTLGRLAGADVNWSHYMGLLSARGHPGFAELWRRMRIVGGAPQAGLERALMQFTRSGSNSMAIGPSRSASGAPLLANDPHLGQQLPNFWLLAGLRCPSYHMVGLMPAGLPFVGVGAGPHAAWGGTNMRAASSDLVDVSELPAHQIETRETLIRVRGLGSRRRRYRVTPYGPILNDARVLRVRGGEVALRWAGADPSDEIGAFLRAARARDGAGFREAFANFGVCAQNILFATRDGDIGHLYAAHLPRRRGWPDDSPILSPEQADAAWSERWDSMSLPLTVNPGCAYRVSANDRPQFDQAPLGFFFSEGDRAARLAELADAEGLDLERLKAFQRDTRVAGAARLSSRLAERLEAVGADAGLVAQMRDWDGDYAAEAAQPVVFETLLHALASALRPLRHAEALRALDDEWARHTRLLLGDLDALDPTRRRKLLLKAARAAQRALQRHPSWGQLHRLRIGHLLSLIPVLGRGLFVADWPAAGTRESPMKNAHGLVRGQIGRAHV
jgi:penicillin amidase